MIVILLLVGGLFYFLMRKPATEIKESPAMTTPAAPAADTLPVPRAIRRLPDSTRVYLLGDTKLEPRDDFPVHREMTLDGDAFLVVSATASALTIHTKLLIIIASDKAAFRVTAPSKEEWAEVDVISGTIIVRKAYSSTFNAPDTLHDGQMQMINRTIDLMEKEEFDAKALKAWSDKLPR